MIQLDWSVLSRIKSNYSVKKNVSKWDKSIIELILENTIWIKTWQVYFSITYIKPSVITADNKRDDNKELSSRHYSSICGNTANNLANNLVKT